MKKVIMGCVTLGFLVMPITLLANEASVNKINRLERKVEKLTGQIDKVVVNSRRARKISEKFKKVAIAHLNVVSSFIDQKSTCQNLEDTYKKKNKEKDLEIRVKIKQKRNIRNCYSTLEGLIYDFEDMSVSFMKLKKSITILKDISETDQAAIPSYEKQITVLEKMITEAKVIVTLSPSEVEDAIDSSM